VMGSTPFGFIILSLLGRSFEFGAVSGVLAFLYNKKPKVTSSSASPGTSPGHSQTNSKE
jgi:hypothetical protein